MKKPLRFKLILLLVFVLFAATVLGMAAMVRRSLDYRKRAEAAQSEMRRYRQSVNHASSVSLHHRILAESPETELSAVAREKEATEASMRDRAFFDEQANRADSLRRAYERIANRPWESEPPSIEGARRRMLDAKHPSFP